MTENTGNNLGPLGIDKPFNDGGTGLNTANMQHQLGATLSVDNENYTHIGTMKTVGGRNYTIVLRKDTDSKIIAGKDEHYTVEVEGFSYGATDRATQGRKGHAKEGNGIILSPTCVCIIENKLYLRDSNNLWHTYSIEESVNDSGTMIFVEESLVKYIPQDVQKEYINNDIATVLSYTTPPRVSNYVGGSIPRIYTSIILKQTPIQGHGDIPISNPENYKRETLRIDSGVIYIVKTDGTQERYGVTYGSGWTNLVFEKLE